MMVENEVFVISLLHESTLRLDLIHQNCSSPQAAKKIGEQNLGD